MIRIGGRESSVSSTDFLRVSLMRTFSAFTKHDATVSVYGQLSLTQDAKRGGFPPLALLDPPYPEKRRSGRLV